MSSQACRINNAPSPGIAEGGLRTVTVAAEAPRRDLIRGPEIMAEGTASANAYKPLPAAPLPAEADFYNEYSWSLNAFPALHEVADHLSEELAKVARVLEPWQRSEVITNIFLLACSLGDTVDDYLLGDVYDFSKAERFGQLPGPAIRAISRLLDLAGWLRARRLASLREWRTSWGTAVVDFLEHCFVDGLPEQAILFEHRDRMSRLLEAAPLPKAAGTQRAKIPAFFRSQDFAPGDWLELSRKFVSAFAADGRPALVVGLRTAGSFLAPLSCAFLRRHRSRVDCIAIRPSKALTEQEQSILRSAAEEEAWVLIVDESIHSEQTLAKAVKLLRHAGFSDQDMVVLNAAEPAFPDWKTSRIFQALPNVATITLEPAERYKSRLLDSGKASEQLEQYFTARGYARAQAVADNKNRGLNIDWRGKPPERADIRLKRLYEVHLRRSEGAAEIRYVLAKSVGWGWLSYHAFLAAEKLNEFVPPLIGLRDGILYIEWIPQKNDSSAQMQNREVLLDSVASYVAARAQRLKLASDPTADLLQTGHKGLAIMADCLSRAYPSRMAAALGGALIQKRLATQGATPVMTDSKMSPQEWVVAGRKLLKTDFEHHAQGKNELGMTDPAYDLAGAAFHFGLSEAESARLVGDYVKQTGDTGVEARLFFNKLLVGLWEQNLATLGLHGANLLHRREESHRQYLRAWNFLVSESIRECGKLCQRPAHVGWKGPLVATGIDGVLDRMVFGFPSATAAGIQAISLLHVHGFTIAANTARSLGEVKQYCRSYGFAGGLAECGAVIWDAAKQQEIGLVSPQSLAQLAEVRNAIRLIPGVYLNDDYRYSLRAFTYQDDRTSPLPQDLVQDLLAKLGAERLQAHQTGLDTAITAKEADKGAGLEALVAVAGIPADEVIAIGDSEPDLATFRVARSSFAPAHITCHCEARLLGCHIVAKPYQPGLLQIARRIVHPEGGTCERCRFVEKAWTGKRNLFVSLLEAADGKFSSSLLMRSFSGRAMLAGLQCIGKSKSR